VGGKRPLVSVVASLDRYSDGYSAPDGSLPHAHLNRELRRARYCPLMNVGAPPEPEYLYNLGTMVPPATINMHQELTEAEWTQLNEAAGAIEQLASPFHYRLVELNFKQLQDLHQYVSITISLGREFAAANRQKLVGSVMGATVNWLTSMRMFLDHEETQLKRKYGESSSEFAAFKVATRQAYDGVVGYRFAYEFRNYAQHCGLPLNHLVIMAPAVPQTHLKQDTKLLLDRDNLLAEFNNWKRVKKDLQAMEPRFEMLPLLEGAMSGIRAINRACTEIDLDKALASAPVLASALDRLKDLAGEPMLIRYRGTPQSGMQVSPRPLHASSVLQLQAVNEGRAARESLWGVSEPPPPPPLPLDPAAIRGRFHRDNRGVQIITAWFQEGGGTPQFLALVNRLIAEDNGIEPVLTGLINVAALLAHMTAGALGTTAEALITGILDLYSQVDPQKFRDEHD
jgi:hypothetical protein